MKFQFWGKESKTEYLKAPHSSSPLKTLGLGFVNQRSMAAATQTNNVKPELRKPVFTKVDQLKPGTNGHTLVVKVINSATVLQKGRSQSQHLRQTRIAECLIGDDTGTIIFTARNEQGSVTPYYRRIFFFFLKICIVICRFSLLK